MSSGYSGSPPHVPADELAAIEQLLARYCHAFDAGDHEAWAGCFEDNGVFAIGGGREVVGRAALVRFARDVGAREPLRHWTGNVLVRAYDGGSALVDSYQVTLAFPHGRDGHAAVRRTARPRSRLVKRDGGWRIAHREARVETEL